MNFLETISKQSEPLKQEVQENEGMSFLTVAGDGEHILCEGAGNPNQIARSILSVLKNDKSLRQAFKEEIEADKDEKAGLKVVVFKANSVEDIKKAVDEIIGSL